MTDKTTDEELNSNPDAEILDEDNYLNEDDDPMLVEMKEAEEEIEAAAKEEGETEDPDKEAPTAEDQGSEEEPKTEEADTDNEMLTVPKARFDQVVSERNLLRDQVSYQQGVIEAKGTSQQPQDNQEDSEPDQEEVSEVDRINAAISEAEAKKLELAAKYDEGEINTVDLRKAEMEIDADIRTLNEEHQKATFEALKEETQNETQEALDANRQQNFINSQAIEIQKEHPNVEVIDSYPEAIRDGIWGQISLQAAHNLQQKGVDIRSNTLDVKLAMMKEKASLTDNYTPENIASMLAGKPIEVSQTNQQQNSQGEPSQKEPSPQALERADKIDLANSQPPEISGMSTGSDGEITEAHIEQMSEDDIADLLDKAPNIVKRATGIT